MNKDIIYGRKPVLSVLDNPENVNKIIISKEAHGSIIKDIIKKASLKKVVYTFLDSKELNKIVENSQGVIAYISSKSYIELEDLVEKLDIKSNPLICILDGITDPHNVGAIARSAYALGVEALILSKRNSCLINTTVYKTSCGAIEFLDVVRVSNLVNCIKELKNSGFWIIGASSRGEKSSNFKFDRPICLVLGSEGKGIKELVKKNCDELIMIPHVKSFDSLNVSCAASILFYEAKR